MVTKFLFKNAKHVKEKEEGIKLARYQKDRVRIHSTSMEVNLSVCIARKGGGTPALRTHARGRGELEQKCNGTSEAKAKLREKNDQKTTDPSRHKQPPWRFTALAREMGKVLGRRGRRVEEGINVRPAASKEHVKRENQIQRYNRLA